MLNGARTDHVIFMLLTSGSFVVGSDDQDFPNILHARDESGVLDDSTSLSSHVKIHAVCGCFNLFSFWCSFM